MGFTVAGNGSRPKSQYGEPGAPIGIAVETLADGTHHVSVWGEVDLATAPHLQQALDDVARGTNLDVLVELSEDSFIDSTGLHVLVDTAQRLRAIGRVLRVTTDNGNIRRVIEMAGLTEELGLTTRALEEH
jgi:anti-sigma B factor antagonist